MSGRVGTPDDSLQVQPKDRSRVHLGEQRHLRHSGRSLFELALGALAFSDVVERREQDRLAIQLELRYVGLGPAALPRLGTHAYVDRLGASLGKSAHRVVPVFGYEVEIPQRAS